MAKNELDELFRRYEGNPILTPGDWPYQVGAVMNPGTTRFDNEVLLLVRVENRQGYSHQTKARSKDGRTNWQIDSEPTLEADRRFGEAVFGLEDSRIVWFEERQEYMITCVSFLAAVVKEPATISLISTKDFSRFDRLGQHLIPPNKDASLFPRTFAGRYALVNRPIVEGKANIWVSFSPDLRHWGDHRILIAVGQRSWDADRVGLAAPPIETPEGWVIIYHGARKTASGDIYRIGLALLDLETLELIRRSKEWVFGPKEPYERVGDVDDIVFICGTVIEEETNELLAYYGAADSVIGLATANLDDLTAYLKTCS